MKRQNNNLEDNTRVELYVSLQNIEAKINVAQSDEEVMELIKDLDIPSIKRLANLMGLCVGDYISRQEFIQKLRKKG